MTQRGRLELWQEADARRLRARWDAFKDRNPDATQAAFAAEHGIGTQGMFYQYVSGTTPLNLAAVIKFARGLRCSIADISPTLAMQVKEAQGLVQEGEQVIAQDEFERQVLTYFRGLDQDGKDAAVGLLNRLYVKAHPGASRSDPYYAVDVLKPSRTRIKL